MDLLGLAEAGGSGLHAQLVQQLLVVGGDGGAGAAGAGACSPPSPEI